jgi:hypothetical protein
MCGRTQREVSESVGHPAQQESDLDRNMSSVAESKARFLRVSGEWWEKVPDQFKGLDFNFVMNNIPQFRSFGPIDEAESARKSIVIPLAMAAISLRGGQNASIGSVRVDASESGKRQTAIKEIDEFEKKTGRVLAPGAQGNGQGGNGSMLHAFDGLKLGQGIGYLRDIGALYYSLQERLLEIEKDDEMSRRPTFGISNAKVSGLAAQVPLCTICQNLILGLVPA